MTFVVVAVTSVIAVRVVVVASTMLTIRLKGVWFVMWWLLIE